MIWEYSITLCAVMYIIQLNVFSVIIAFIIAFFTFRLLSISCFCLGIAPNTMIAKVCSDKNKPNGQFAVAPSAEAVLSFMRDLPIRKVFR